jgi:hypothetical protein
MRRLFVGALVLVVAGCGGSMGQDQDQTLKTNIQQAREAYETCMTIHNGVDPNACASYRAEWENDKAVWTKLHPGVPLDQPPPEPH